MPFPQTTIRSDIGHGIPGEIAFDSPSRVTPYNLNSASAANNIFGRYFTRVAGSENLTTDVAGDVQAGGTGTVGGILINPRNHVGLGDGTWALGSDSNVGNGTAVELLSMGIVFVMLATGGGRVGNRVQYNTTTGELDLLADGASPASGFAIVPNAQIDRHDCQAGTNVLAIIKLTN